ncbi:MAG: peptidase M14, partial [Pseudomonadota bacterium]
MIADDTLLLRTRFEPSLTTLRRDLARPQFKGATIELWTFDNLARRAALADALNIIGAQAVVRSAYKPLVHAFLEEIDITGAGADAVEIG